MMRLTGDTIIRNYKYSNSGRIDEGEHLDCALCGGHFTKAGTVSIMYDRTADDAPHLQPSIELCKPCNYRIEDLQQDVMSGR